MILEKQTEANIEKTGDSQESIGMSLDLESAQVLMQMLSKNLYSDAVGSTIRECASNALDSHRRSGTTDPIIVSFETNNGQFEFSVEDFGIGLDADDVKNIISKYGKSTKRNSTTELGMMGLGFKAPLAYSSSFYFVCRKNGVERKYMMYEGEDTNTIDQLYEMPTTDRNGVKVIVPVKHYDKGEFLNKIREQLAYFQNVYFNVPELDNNFTIIRSEDFQWSQLCSDGRMHICLDDVYYPIDFDKIGLKNIYFPVGLRFSLTDGIFPTPNREAIRYTKEAKAAILEKITKVANFYVQKFNEDMKETDDLQCVIDWHRWSSKFMRFEGRRLDIGELSKLATISLQEPKLKGVKLLTTKLLYDQSSMIMAEYENKYTIERGKMRKTETSWRRGVNYGDVLSDSHIFYIYSDKVGGNMRDYLKELHPSGQVHLIKKVNTIILRKALRSDTYYEILSLKKYPKSEWRARIKEWQSVVGMITKHFRNLDEVEIPQAWLDKKKKKHLKLLSNGQPKPRKVKLAGEIVGRVATPLERYVSGQECKFVSTTYKLGEIHKIDKLCVYGREANRKQMDEFYRCFKPVVNFVIFSDREFNAMQKLNIHNWISMEQFLKGDSKPFKRIATAYMIETLTDKYSDAFKRHNNVLEKISKDLFAKIIMLIDYEQKHCHHSSDTIKKIILDIAEPNGLFDGEIYPIYKEVKKVLDELHFIDTVCEAAGRGYHDDDTKERWALVMRDLFRFHKRRMDWSNYNIKLNEEIVAPITEEIIQEA